MNYFEESGRLTEGTSLPRRREFPLYVVVTLLAALAAVPWSWELVCRQNRPVDHPMWAWTKVHLRNYPVGAKPMMTGPQCFAGNRANLHVWHGFQEMVLLRPIDPGELHLRVKMDLGASLVIFLERHHPVPDPDEAPGLALRLSSNPHTPSAWLMVDGEGRFVEKHLFDLPAPFNLSRWRWIRVQCCEDEIVLYLDHAPISRIKRALSGSRYLAFRGSMARYFCAVDDLAVVDRSERCVFVESFDRRDLWGFSWVMCFMVLWIPGGLMLFITRFIPSYRTAVAALTCLALVSLAGGGLVFWYMATVQRNYYPPAEPLFSTDEAYACRLIEERCAETNASCSQPDGRQKLIFLGSSQTWGEGASEPYRSWVAEVIRRLNARVGSPVYQAINLGVSAAVSRQMADLYACVAPMCPHQLLCVNLGVNDNYRKTPFMAESLERIIRMAQAHGARVVLLSEAVVPDLFGYGVTQPYEPVIRGIAERFGVSYLNVGEAIGQDDDGLRWWDVVHPTDYGHRLIAEAVVPVLAAVLDEEEARKSGKARPLGAADRPRVPAL